MLGEGYYLVGQHLVHDITRFWPSDIRGGKLVILDVLRDQPKSCLLKMTPQIPTMTMIYRRNRKSVISTLVTYLIDVYRVFNHLGVYSDFLSLSPLRLSVFGQLIIGYKLLWRMVLNFKVQIRHQVSLRDASPCTLMLLLCTI